jgi:ribose transport system substrate-binding protein
MRFLWLIALVAVVGCSSPDSKPNTRSSEGGEKKYRIAVIPKGTSHQFWKSVYAGSLQAANEIGNVEIIWQGPALENEVDRQIAIVQDMILQEVDGIILAPNNSESLVSVVREANASRIPVVIFDSALAEGAEIVSYVATDNENGGRLAAERLATVLGEEGDVILMRYLTGSESTEMREKGFLEKISEYPKIKVLSSDQHATQGVDRAKEKAEQLLLNYEDRVNGFFAVCESNAEGALLAIDTPQFAGKVKFIAFDPSDQLIEGLKNDKVHGIVLQDPVRMGYLSVKAMVDHLQGKSVEKRIGTGEYVATKENMDTEKMQRLLNPVQQE